jgi:hypothetical protein
MQLHPVASLLKNIAMPTLLRKYVKLGRNEPCPCKSGKKFKHCCALVPEQQHDAMTIEPKQIKKFIIMTEEILRYLTKDRSFDAGVRIYQRYGKNHAFLRKFNLQGATPQNVELLHYRLFKLTGRPDQEFTQIMLKPVEQTEPEAIEETPAEPTPAPKAEMSAVDAVKFNLRKEFPFLSQPSCPDAFKILVADMITAYENHISSHQELFDVKDEKEAFEVADKVIENYLDNRSIWDELNHYKATGKILGKHKHFAAMKRKDALMKKSVPELIKLKEQLEMNIWRNKKKLDEDPKPHLLKQRQERIAGYETDLKIVKSLLNINE